jgi:hypothetical protein
LESSSVSTVGKDAQKESPDRFLLIDHSDSFMQTKIQPSSFQQSCTKHQGGNSFLNPSDQIPSKTTPKRSTPRKSLTPSGSSGEKAHHGLNSFRNTSPSISPGLESASFVKTCQVLYGASVQPEQTSPMTELLQGHQAQTLLGSPSTPATFLDARKSDLVILTASSKHFCTADPDVTGSEDKRPCLDESQQDIGEVIMTSEQPKIISHAWLALL